MLLRISKLGMVLALAGSIGLHWTVLQSAAWVGMMVSYSHDSSLTEAFVKTFDGNHPCGLCQQITKGKQSEKKSDAQMSGKKLEFLDARSQFVFQAPRQFFVLLTFNDSFAGLTHTPPVPPPKSLCS